MSINSEIDAPGQQSEVSVSRLSILCDILLRSTLLFSKRAPPVMGLTRASYFLLIKCVEFRWNDWNLDTPPGTAYHRLRPKPLYGAARHVMSVTISTASAGAVLVADGSRSFM